MRPRIGVSLCGWAAALMGAAAAPAQGESGVITGECDVPAPNTGFMVVAGGGSHWLGLKADDSIVAWGENGYDHCSAPAPNTQFVAIAGGRLHSLGLKADGSIAVRS